MKAPEYKKEELVMIRVNGSDIDLAEVGLLDLLADQGYDPKRIAVEVNEEIVPKSQYASCILHSGDVVEVVSFVGGG